MISLQAIPSPAEILNSGLSLQVRAPGQELAQGSTLGSSNSARLESSLHLQGAVAVSGEATLWRNTPDRNQWPHARRSMDSPFDDDFQANSSSIFLHHLRCL